MAALLKIPIVTLAKAIDIDGAKLRVTRMLRHRHEIVELAAPAVVMVAGKVGALRYLYVVRTFWTSWH
jgi:electron transfer flavoprotein alpha/beta subunit